MMRSISTTCLAVALLFAIAATAPAATVKHLVRVDIAAADDITDLLALHPDIATFRHGDYLEVVATDGELDRIESLGYETSVMTYDLNSSFQNEINRDGDLGAYTTYDEMVPLLQLAAARFPDICRLYDIGDSWEKTAGLADRDIWALKISDNPEIDESSEPEIFFVGNHHARELITVEIPLAIGRELLVKYGRDPVITQMVDEKETWIVPMMNPDGHVRVETVDSWWRKNTNHNGSENPWNWGVDLNRNYGYQWGFDNWGSSPDRSDETYRGTGPFSEPETQAVRDLAESHEFTVAISYHSFGDLFLIPWGYIDADTPDHPTFELISQAYTQFNNYVWGNPKDGVIYNTNGDHDDWMYGEQVTKNRVYGCTVEVGNDFWPPESQIPSLIEENLPGALLLIRAI